MATTTANLRDLYREALTYRDVREAVNRASHNPSFGHHVLAWDAALAAVEDLVGPRLAPFRSLRAQFDHLEGGSPPPGSSSRHSWPHMFHV